MRTVAIIGGAFNPPHNGHLEIARICSERFDEVIIIPCALRPEKPELAFLTPIDRMMLCTLAFESVPQTRLEFFDLPNLVFSKTYELQKMFEHMGQIWHVIGSDNFQPLRDGRQYFRHWERGEEMWQTFNFAIMVEQEFPVRPADIPPHRQLFYPKSKVHSSDIRALVCEGKPISGLVPPMVELYIRRKNLYKKDI